MKVNDKLVSVIIPTYKRPDTLTRAINSVISQTYNNIEIIVVDDNDPETAEREKTRLVMNQYENIVTVKYIEHPYNKNGAAARNTGFRVARGDYIAFLDDDDEFLPNKVEKQVQCLESIDKIWGACYTNYIRKYGDKIYSRSLENREGFLLKEELMRNLWVAAGSNLMVRRTVVEHVGGFDESFKRNQDVEFLVKILKNYKLAHVPIEGLVVYMHDEHKNKIDFNLLTKQFIDTFKSEIESFSNNDQSDIYQMLNLQVYRYYLTSRQYKHAIKMITTKKISCLNGIMYLFHLLYRRITKKSKPYVLK